MVDGEARWASKDEPLIAVSEVWGYCAGCYLIARGAATNPPKGNGISVHSWVKSKVSRKMWNKAVEEVKAMTPDQRAVHIAKAGGVSVDDISR